MRVLNTPYITHLRPPTDPRYPISTLEVLRFEVSWYCCVYPVEIQMLPSDVMGNNLPLSSFFCDEVGPSQPLDLTPVVSASTQRDGQQINRTLTQHVDSPQSAAKRLPSTGNKKNRPKRFHCSLAYSAFASFSIGISGSASFQSVRKSL